MRRFLFDVAILIVLGASPASAADVLLDQPPDFRQLFPSYQFFGGGQTGDDFRIAQPVLIETVTFWMAATSSSPPFWWAIDIYETTSEDRWYAYSPPCHPAFRMVGAAEVIDLGPWPDDESLRIFEVRFENINFRLDPGPVRRAEDDSEEPTIGGWYWFSCEGYLWDDTEDDCFWITSGKGKINWDIAWEKSESTPPCDWRPLRQYVEPSDCAMRIEGTPIRVGDQDDTTITDVEIVAGRHFDGTSRELRFSDDLHFITISEPGSRAHHMQMIVRARTSVEHPIEVDLTVESSTWMVGGDFPTGVVTIQNAFMRNWRTGRFDSLGEFWIWEDPVTVPFQNLDAANYVNDYGEVEVLIEHAHPWTPWYAWFFFSYIDRVQIEVTGGG